MARPWKRRGTRRAHRHVCPACRSGNVERVSRHGLFERVVLTLLGRRPYRCLECGARFHNRVTGSGA